MAHNHVIVAGGGPVGLTTALGLARAGVEVTVVERDAEIGSAPRALIYYFFTLPEFERLGLLDDLEEIGLPVEGLTFHDRATGRRATTLVSAMEGRVSHPRNVSIGQDTLSAVVLRHLTALPGVTVLPSTTVTAVEQDADGVTVTVEDSRGSRRLVGDYLVGADGASSAVRRSQDIEFRGFTYPDRLIATNIVFDFAAHGYGTGNFVIDPVHGAIVVQITKDLWRCTFRDIAGPDASVEPNALRARVEEWLTTALPGENPKYELVSFSPYRIHQRCAATFRSGRVLLAGDAAHITNPLGGLGLTSGLCDAFVLGDALAAVVTGRESDAVIDLYAAERRKAFLDVVWPNAVMNKQLVLDLEDPAVKEEVLSGVLANAANPEFGRHMLGDLARIHTPSVVGRKPVDATPRPLDRGCFWVGGTEVPVDGGTVVRGQMFVEWSAPADGGNGTSVVLVHGGGGQGTDFLTTPDGRAGWAALLAEAGYSVYVVDRPGHGRSPYHPDVLGPMTPVMGSDVLRALFRNPPEGPFSHPMTVVHSQWPGGDEPGDAVAKQFLSSAGPLMADSVEAQALARDGLVELLERIGPAVVLTHSLGGPSGYLVADARPDLVRALVQVEPVGPQFLKNPDLGLDLAWGLTSAPVTYEPPVADPAELDLVKVPAPTPFPVTLQADPPRRLANLARVPIALVSAEGSAFRWFDEPVSGFLRQAGCRVDLVRLWEHGVRGNGHGMMMELNNADALSVVTEWVERTLAPTVGQESPADAEGRLEAVAR